MSRRKCELEARCFRSPRSRSAMHRLGVVGVVGASASEVVKVAIMTDCKGAFAFGYEVDIGGAQAAFAQFAGGKAEEQRRSRPPA